MNKKLPLVAGIVILLLGIGTFLIMSGNSSPPQPQTSPGPQTSSQKSIKDLLSLTKPQECSFDDSSNKGSVFVANNKMRGDFNTKAEETEIKSHIIVDNQTSYLWIDGQDTGYKMSFEKLSEDPATNQQGQMDINKQLDYNCKDWSVDLTVFNIPSDIKFTDLSVSTSPTSSDANAISCSACDSLSGEAKTQCKTALKCS